MFIITKLNYFDEKSIFIHSKKIKNFDFPFYFINEKGEYQSYFFYRYDFDEEIVFEKINDGCRKKEKVIYDGNFFVNDNVKYKIESNKFYFYVNDRLLCDSEFKNGLPNGKVITYNFEGKKIIETNVINGYFNGPGKIYNLNGNIYYEVNYKNNNIIGKGKKYYENGQILYEGSLLDGKYNGIGKIYDYGGNIIYHGKFSNGKIHQ